MSPSSIFTFVVPAVAAVLAVSALGCSDPVAAAADVAGSCGKQTCPAGTTPKESRTLSASNDVSAGYNPATYSADGAYKRYGSGSCEYACEVDQPCPANTFPVITQSCFTCGAVTSDGIAQGACTDEGKVAIECGKQECPYGTGFEEKRSITSGYDISKGYDPSYDPATAYGVFGSGACEFACKVLYPCPTDTFPVMTRDCFTCGQIVNGVVLQGNCGGTADAGVDATSTDAAADAAGE